ncbi:MAG: MFS transporter [Desulfobacula sp.]|jgi:MFS transporter, DHA3 family, macrolide efflux protein|nr:MFS transporter [Desulfobacula sp.]MBT6341392.1 MFS transporter [Desulfobacula sp.]MBT7261892.1 MFS transporter [Desulfobacula sp.]
MINRNFFYLLTGQFVSQIGDKFHYIALSFWVLKTTGSSAKMGAVLAASLIPSLIIGFFSGAFIDRYNRKYIIVGTDLLRGLIIALFALLFYFEMMNFYVILLMQALLSANAAFFDPAIPSVIPQIVNEKDLATANSKHQFVNGFSTIAGAFLAGIFISYFGYLWVFIINAVSFILSAGLECFIQIPHKQEHVINEKQLGILEDMKQGYQYIFSKRVLVILLFMVMVIHFFVGSIEVFMPVISDAISLDGARTFGFFQAAFGLGTIIMAIVLSMKNIYGKEKTALFVSVFCVGLLYVSASFFSGNPIVLLSLFLVMIFLFGCCIICAGISFKTLLQKSIDNKFAGRVFAVAGSVGNAAIPGAMIVYGVLLEKYEYQNLLMVSGLVLMVLSIISLILYKEKKDGRATKTFSKSVT